MAICRRRGQASRLLRYVSPPGGPPRVQKAGTAGKRRAGAGTGLPAWALPTYSYPGGGGPRGSPHLLRLQPRGRAVNVVGARSGPNGEEITVNSHQQTALLAERCQLPAAAAQSRSAKVRCREVVAGSAPSGARLAAPPHLQAPPPGPALRCQPPTRTVSGPSLPFSRRPGSRPRPQRAAQSPGSGGGTSGHPALPRWRL